MALIRSDPNGLKTPAFKRVVVVQTDRGNLKMQAWPRRRGKPTHPTTLIQNSWLTWSARALKYTSSIFWDQATVATKGTGLYPRDLLTLAADGRLYDVVKNDGQVITRQDTKLEIKVYNGAILRLTANVTLPINTVIAPNWPLPILDTFTFWDVAAPDRLTIPEGVDVVEFTGGGSIIAAGATRFLTSIQNSAGLNVAFIDTEIATTHGQTVSTGPIPVVAGDWFRLIFLTAAARTLIGNQSTFFSVNVLGSH